MIVLRSGLGRILAGCEAVLFDKDGTLVDIHHYWASMIRLRASLLAEQCSVDVEEGVLADRLIWAMGVDQTSGRIRPEGPVGVQPRSVIVSVATEVIHEFGLTVTEAEVEQAFAEVCPLCAAYLKLIKLSESASKNQDIPPKPIAGWTIDKKTGDFIFTYKSW